MRRVLLILLLVIVPFQLAWAAAGDYCQHESGSAGRHFGHHSHQHQGNEDKSPNKSKAAKVHADCGACHGIGTALFGQPGSVTTALFATPIAPAINVFYTSHISDCPLRPERAFS